MMAKEDGMNISLTNIGTDTYKHGSVLAGNLPILQGGGLNGLKSTQEKMERQQQTQGEIAFWEKQKENLKEHECETPEEIAEKLNMLHTYEDQIAAAKAAYNSEQMWHILDEAKEIGEKIAEAAEKMEPKTPEERREEIIEEAMGTEDSGGLLEEVMEDAAQTQEELQEAVEEEVLEQLGEELPEDLQEQLNEDLPETLTEQLNEDLPETLTEQLNEDLPETLTEQLNEELAEDVRQKLDEELTEGIERKLGEELTEDIRQKAAEEISYRPINILI